MAWYLYRLTRAVATVRTEKLCMCGLKLRAGLHPLVQARVKVAWMDRAVMTDRAELQGKLLPRLRSRPSAISIKSIFRQALETVCPDQNL